MNIKTFIKIASSQVDQYDRCVFSNRNTVRIYDPEQPERECRQFRFEGCSSQINYLFVGAEKDRCVVNQSKSGVDVEQTICQQMVNKSLNGFNCSLILRQYLPKQDINENIVRKYCKKILNFIQKHNKSQAKVKYNLQISIFDIYMDEIADLLGDRGQQSTNLKLIKNNEGKEQIQKLSHHQISNYQQFDYKMQQSIQNFQQINVYKQRFPAAVTITYYFWLTKLEIIDKNILTQRKNLILFIEPQSKIEKYRKQTQNLLKILLLNREKMKFQACIDKLSLKFIRKVKNIIVPYRDSSLTMILRSTLSQNTVTLMLTHIYSDSGKFKQSLNNLRFSSSVQSILTNYRPVQAKNKSIKQFIIAQPSQNLLNFIYINDEKENQKSISEKQKQIQNQNLKFKQQLSQNQLR